METKRKNTPFNFSTDSESETSHWADILIVLILGIIWGAFVLKTMWNWFIPPVFEALPYLNMGSAAGINMFLSVVKGVNMDSKTRPIWVTFLMGIILGIFYLVVGFVVHLVIS